MAHGSELYTGYALDGLGQEPNEDEFASVPDLDHIIQLPWEPKVAWMPADITFKGEPYPLNTRVALKNVLKQAADLGFGFNLGIECEVFVLKKNGDGRLEVPNPNDNLTKPCYDIAGFLDNFTWLDKVATCINELGWDLYSFDHEDANGQYRVRLPLCACADDLRPLRLLPLHGQALRQGARPDRDDDAEAVRRQDRLRRAFQHVAL